MRTRYKKKREARSRHPRCVIIALNEYLPKRLPTIQTMDICNQTSQEEGTVKEVM
jgi:hypothetical protein